MYSFTLGRLLLLLAAAFVLGASFTFALAKKTQLIEEVPAYVTAPDGTQIRQPAAPPSLPQQGDPRTQSMGPTYAPPSN